MLAKFASLQSILVVSGLLLAIPLTEGIQAQQLSEELLAPIHYREIGPTRQGGRIADFAVNPQDSTTFYVGTANGGVWKTANNGNTFEPIFDRQTVSSIGSLAVAPSDPNVVWVGTGEANDGGFYWGDGVYKSVDGGATWRNMGLSETHHIGRVLIHPDDPNTVYVAAHGKLYSESAERGLYKTTDGGQTWSKVLEIVRNGFHVGVIDVVMDPTDAETLYAAAWNKVRRPWTAWDFNLPNPSAGIHKTTDGGRTWRELTNGLPKGEPGRIGIDIYRRDPNILYASIDEGRVSGGRFDNTRIYRSDDAGETWRLVSPADQRLPGGSYFGVIRVDPNDPDHVYILSNGSHESRDGGRTWQEAFRYGGDNHALWIDPNDSRRMLFGYDYGFAISHDAGKNWYHPDELPLAQLYEIDADNDYPYNVYAGIYDFGSWKGPSTKKGRFPIRFEDWEHITGGDGFYNRVDPSNSRWLYSESQNGGLVRVDQETGRRRNIRYEGDASVRFNFNAPVLISPHDPNVLYQGANVLLRSPFRGEAWEIVSPDLTTDDPARRGLYCTISTIAESPVQQGVIWVGTDDGNVQLSRDGGATWTLLNDRIPDNPGYWVKRIVASHHDAGTAYVALSGYFRDDFSPYLYKTTDFGETWSWVVGNLPEESIAALQEDPRNPNLLFVGTNRSVHVSLDGGSHWTRMQNDMPTVGIQDLLIHPRESDLIVGTHGRGFFIADISPLQELTSDVLSRDAHLFRIEPKVQWIIAHQTTVSAQNFAGENEPHGVVVNYYLRDGSAGEVVVEIFKGARLISEYTGSGEPGLNALEWGMTERILRTPEEIATWDRRNRFRAEDNEYYDYYDLVDYYGAADEEVTMTGRSMRTRVHDPGPTEREFKHVRVPPGEYTIVLTVDGVEHRRTVEILQDHWFDR